MAISPMSGFSALNMSALLQSAYQNTQSAPASDPLAAANARVAGEIASTNVKLSAYSKMQSDLVALQPASATLAGVTSATGAASVVGAVQAFASGYNNAMALTQSSLRGALAGDVRAEALGRDLKSIMGSTSAASLNAMGISVNASNGQLSVDAVALQKALAANPAGVTSTLAGIGAQSARVAGRELSAAGNVGAQVAALGSQSSSLSAQLALQQGYASSSQTLTGSIVSAYQKIGLM